MTIPFICFIQSCQSKIGQFYFSPRKRKITINIQLRIHSILNSGDMLSPHTLFNHLFWFYISLFNYLCHCTCKAPLYIFSKMHRKPVITLLYIIHSKKHNLRKSTIKICCYHYLWNIDLLKSVIVIGVPVMIVNSAQHTYLLLSKILEHFISLWRKFLRWQ